MRSILLLCFTLGYAFNGTSQVQQISITLEEAEKIFLQNNLTLLAKQYNISAKQALIIQAKAYPNPTFNADFNVYDPQHNQVFHVDSSGQKSFQIQQLIILGGKRKTEIDIAKQNKVLAESEFAELLRALKLQLYRNFYSIIEHKTVIANFQKQLNILDTIIGAYNVQVNKGNIPLKDVIRLKSVYIKINNNKSELSTYYNEEQKKIKILLQINQDITPVILEDEYNFFTDLKPITDLQTIALSNRPDLKIADESTIIAALYLKLQKKQVVPDIAVNGSYDQRGGAFRNQINAGITMPLPITNTNRGNVKAAEFDKKAMEVYLQEKKLEIELDIQEAWLNMQRSILEYRKVKTMFNDDFTQVNIGVNNNFSKRNISILEFVDFVEAYNESLAEFERIKTQLAISAAEINFVTATKVY
ncbi:MAG: TolC family protein [Burkholderiales bacterium]|nr:TolC family protein [Bacteroidia bacterium]